MDRIKKIKVLLGMVKEQFETAKLADGSEVSFDLLEINREVYDSEGNPLAEGEYTLEDGTKITVDVNGVIKEIVKADGETEKEEVVEEMADEAEGTGKNGNTITSKPEADANADETGKENKPEETPESEPVTADLEARLTELENKVDELYNIILKLTEEQREKEERITEIKEEFATIKANPSASPVFINSNESKPLSRIEKLRNLKNQ